MSTHAPSVRAEDLMSVGSRISWGAILGGGFVALALYFMLSVLGAAAGLSLSHRMDSGQLQTTAIIWNVVVLSISLFVGGVMSSLFTAGENKVEAVFFGVIMWGFVIGALILTAAAGVHGSMQGLVGMANVTDGRNWETQAREAGVSQETIDEWRRKAAGAAEKTVPPNREEIREAAKKAAWWVFGGTWVSTIAAALGGWIGAGPTFRLARVENPIRIP